jgi:hypothetical protein
LAIWIVHSSIFGKFGPFFNAKSFVWVEIMFFKSKFGENSLVKETLSMPMEKEWQP